MKRQFLPFLLFILLCLLLIFLDGRQVLRPLKKVVESFASPIQRSFYSIRIKSSAGREPTDLAQKLAEAEHEIAFLKAQTISLQEENEAMRRLLGAPLPSSWQFLPAKVIGEENGLLKIDKGRSDGIEKMPTVVVDGVFVGRLLRVSEVFSLVQTLKNPDLKLAVFAKPEKGEGVVARGLLTFREGQLFLEKILIEEEVRSGDLVLTTGEEGLAPNVPIGVVTEVATEKGGLYKKAVAKPFFERNYPETVFLIKVK